jgi:hypothetical protein
MTCAYDMWRTLINVYEENNQVKAEVKDTQSQGMSKN